MQKAFGVRVTIRSPEGGPVLQPLAVAARDERDAELIAAAAAGRCRRSISEISDYVLSGRLSRVRAAGVKK